MSITRRSFVALAATALATRPGLAADWPAGRAITVIVPYAAGGGVDQMVRVVLPYVQRHLPGSSFVVENKPGAAGQIGADYTFNARPDGYTLGAATSPTLTTVALDRPVRYRVADFVYIANVVDDPCALWVAKASPVGDAADLFERATKAPRTISVGTAGVGSDDHVLQLEIEQAKPGLEFNHIPFSGGAPVITALLGGHLDVGSVNISEAIAHHREGTLRCLVQGGAKRDPALPDVPTLREVGIDVVAGAQRGIVAPPGLPKPIEDALTAAFAAAIADPAFLADAQKVQLPVSGTVGDAYRRSMLEIDTRLKEMWARKPWRDR
ncbi:MAG: tripartite tricarboxylate transporter substrate binding protein [Rhodoplanes sp.]|uniref:Bug family tripartite tricarboxylate transporter substrate binding protein n=1 Tax=Rhodoplanes sp. TaxID=1968906 RepID=UPI0018059314|nr:tripartite tricarboxylate transporter substrate binding protein [Rhodoplanes sp.]NVO16088.1 tripartite tricarboxylate transporter substrate binding protein [Rhodoplanes sp.]